MRRLLLLRHAKSDWSVGGQRDIDRELAERGRKVAPLLGRYLARHGLRPDLVMVSNARRTRETWDFIAPAFAEAPAVVYEPRLYEAHPKLLIEIVREAPDEVHTLMLVGHNPGMQQLADLLVGSGDIHARQNLVQKFPTAALAVIDFPVDHWRAIEPSAGRLDRFVMPKTLDTDDD